MKRRVGLSRRSQTKPLHPKISKKANISGNHKLSSTKEVGVNDPPLSSDDEDSTDAVGEEASSNVSTSSKNKQPPLRSLPVDDQGLDSSSDEGGAGADIASTGFSQVAKSGNRKRKATTKDRIDGSEKKCSDDLLSAKKTRRQGDGGSSVGQQSASSNPHVNEFGFTQLKKPNMKYGNKKSGLPNPRSENKTKEAAARSKKTETASTSKLRLKRPPDDQPADLLYSPKHIKGRIVKPKSPTSPSQSPTGRVMLPSSIDGGLLDDSPKKKFKIPANFGDLSETGPVSGKTINTTIFDLSSDLEEKSSPSPVANQSNPTVTATVCPWCEQPVDKALLDDFSRGKRMNVRQQTMFCRHHKKQTAKETWRSMKYPEVDWEGLEKRFEAHRSYLLGIVDGDASHYRRILARKIETGEARSMMKEGNMNPGYYGPRGLRVMCDYLVEEFGELLKRKAVNDRVIAGRGPAAFIQCVLVAELAMSLIRDDMDVTAEDARGILEESKALGEILHDET